MVQKPATAILSSGKIAYPMHRPVGAVWQGKGGEGRVVVLGSATMAEDEWLDKEDNAKARRRCKLDPRPQLESTRFQSLIVNRMTVLST